MRGEVHPDLSYIACPVRCQCGGVLITTEELQDHFRFTRHPWYRPMNGGYT
ncbi:MAG: hypothetical protein V3U45_08315 [bacterium]